MSGNNNTEGIGIVGQFENVLKFVTGAVGLVAAIGFPAVAVHLVSYGVPVSRANYDYILRAGVLPALVLIVMVAYAYAAGQVVARAGVPGLLTVHLLPIFVPAIIVLFCGFFAYIVLILWAMLWVPTWLLGRWYGTSVSNQTLLIVVGVFLVIFYGVYGLLLATRRYWADRPGRFWQWLAQVVEKVGNDKAEARREKSATPIVGEEQASSAPSNEPAAGPVPNESAARWEWAIGLTFIPISVLVLYSIRGVLYVWDPSLAAYLPHRYIFYASIFFGLLFTLLMVGIMTWSGTSHVDAGKSSAPGRAMVVTVGLAYILFEVSYCWWGYPRMYSGLGGGRPTPVTVWLKSDDGVADILALLTRARQTTTEGAKRLDGVFVLFDNAEGIVLTDALAAPASTIFIPRDRVTALSW